METRIPWLVTLNYLFPFRIISISTNLPKNSVKAVDIWMTFSLFLSFSSILVHVIIDNERQKNIDKLKNDQTKVTPISSITQKTKAAKSMIQKRASCIGLIVIPLCNYVFTGLFIITGLNNHTSESYNC